VLDPSALTSPEKCFRLSSRPRVRSIGTQQYLRSNICAQYMCTRLEGMRAGVVSGQALILAPTHEIALQSAEVLGQLSAHMPAPGVSMGVFIGGLPISEDQKLLRRYAALPTGFRCGS